MSHFDKPDDMITIIAGTNRPNSNSLKLAKYYQRQLLARDVAADIFSLCDLPENFITADMYGKRSEAFEPIQTRVSSTEKFVFVIPEYNGSFPGILKTFVDACQFPDSFFEKKAALVGHSTGKYGNIRGIDHFTGVCHYVRLHVLPLRIHIPNIRQELNEHDDLFQQDTVRFTNEQIESFIRF